MEPADAKSPEDAAKDDLEGPPGLSKPLAALSIDRSALSPKSKSIHPSSPGAHGSFSASPKSPISRRVSSNALRQKDDRTVSRRVSSTSFNRHHDNTPPPKPEEKPPLTSSNVASEFFRKELLKHDTSEAENTDTIVFTHDACYGHRYSRPRTSKTTLSLIVERPERLQAGMMGLSLAYTRIGQRHAGGSHEPHPNRAPGLDLPFRIRKTSRTVPITSPIVAAVHGTRWTQEMKTMCLAAEKKLATDGKELARPETPASANTATKPALHEGDLYICKESLDAFEGALGGVCDAIDAVFDDYGDKKACKKAFVCIRPPGHHCSADWPSGFCWLNNVHIGIEHAIQVHGLTHAAILDFDLHHGDGSQAIAWERNARSVKAQKSSAKNAAFKRSTVGYFSIHDINSYPCEDGDFDKVQRASVCIEDSHGQTIWNTHLLPWAKEEEFWELYEKKYIAILEKAKAYLVNTTRRLRSSNPTCQPKAAIFLSAGFDASEWEMSAMQRHKVNVPTEFFARFTSDAVRLAQAEGTGVDGRVVSVLEGGYSDRALTSGILSHVAGLTSLCEASEESDTRMGTKTWNSGWWSAASLQELENLSKPIAPPPPPRKQSGPKEIPTYQTPTQSFTAKVVDPLKLSRHTSINMPTPPKSRPATPPPPEVHWTTAAYELSKLLIPSETRRVDSCSHEELNEPKKKERHSSIGPQTLPIEPLGNRMQTRGRKAKQTGLESIDPSDRRKTISELPIHPEDVHPHAEKEEVSTKANPRPPSRGRPPSTARNEAGLKIPKTRRLSTGKEIVSKASSDAPPVPPLPGAKGQGAANGIAAKDDVDTLTSKMNKITLKLPNSTATADSKTSNVTGLEKVARKPATDRIPKQTTARTTKSKDPSAVKSTAERVDCDNSSNLTAAAKDQSQGQLSSHCSSEESAIQALNPPPHLDGTQEVPGSQIDANPVVTAPEALHLCNSPIEPESLKANTGQPNSEEMGNTQSPHEDRKQRQDAQALDFIAYQPPSTSKSSIDEDKPSFQQEPLKWLPPNTNTPPKALHRLGKENLPVFTAEGRIPFSNFTAGRDSIVESGGSSASPHGKPPDINEGSPSSTQQFANLGKTTEAGDQQSIWEIPLTPKGT